MKQREIWEDPHVMEAHALPDWTGDEWADRKRERLHRNNRVTATRSVLDVRRYGKRLELTEFAVFENGIRLKDGFDSREKAIAWAQGRWIAVEGSGSEPH